MADPAGERKNQISFLLPRVVFGVAFLLSALGYFLRVSEGFAGALLVLASYLLFAAAAVRFSRRGRAGIRGNGFARQKEKAEVYLDADPGSKFTVCRVRIRTENRLTGETRYDKASVYGEGSRAMAVSDACCGKLRISVDQAWISDPLFLFRKRMEEGSRAEIAVMPEAEPYPVPEDYLDAYNMKSFEYSRHRPGTDPSQVFGIREYREGDSVRSIHWKLSAKLDDTVVKIPSYPVENNIIVLFNNSLPEGEELDPERRSGLAELFFSVSRALLDKGKAHGAGWYDVENGVFEIREINNTEEMWAVMADMLGAGFVSDGGTTVGRYLGALEGQPYSNHFFITAGDSPDIDKLEQIGAVRIFTEKK